MIGTYFLLVIDFANSKQRQTQRRIMAEAKKEAELAALSLAWEAQAKTFA